MEQPTWSRSQLLSLKSHLMNFSSNISHNVKHTVDTSNDTTLTGTFSEPKTNGISSTATNATTTTSGSSFAPVLSNLESKKIGGGRFLGQLVSTTAGAAKRCESKMAGALPESSMFSSVLAQDASAAFDLLFSSNSQVFC